MIFTRAILIINTIKITTVWSAVYLVFPLLFIFLPLSVSVSFPPCGTPFFAVSSYCTVCIHPAVKWTQLRSFEKSQHECKLSVVQLLWKIHPGGKERKTFGCCMIIQQKPQSLHTSPYMTCFAILRKFYWISFLLFSFYFCSIQSDNNSGQDAQFLSLTFDWIDSFKAVEGWWKLITQNLLISGSRHLGSMITTPPPFLFTHN